MFPPLGLLDVYWFAGTRQTIPHKPAKTKTYNSEDSLVVTHPTTNSPACGLSTAERTGSPVFHTLWSYVSGYMLERLIELNYLEMKIVSAPASRSLPCYPRE
ncbi:hypothetical protein N7527_005548 [Penicillium freii]|uniref:Uncharacterized protein n=1 Tax=Penicillium freii TaxID=48697 RepID=A0A101MBR9_PENFR|nr:hypothetical protein N7527_005548 [Penicillium freii]KUM57669.1 hypothetical protein ACN42_g9504 [Penicillium freii]